MTAGKLVLIAIYLASKLVVEVSCSKCDCIERNYALHSWIPLKTSQYKPILDNSYLFPQLHESIGLSHYQTHEGALNLYNFENVEAHKSEDKASDFRVIYNKDIHLKKPEQLKPKEVKEIIQEPKIDLKLFTFKLPQDYHKEELLYKKFEEPIHKQQQVIQYSKPHEIKKMQYEETSKDLEDSLKNRNKELGDLKSPQSHQKQEEVIFKKAEEPLHKKPQEIRYTKPYVVPNIKYDEPIKKFDSFFKTGNKDLEELLQHEKKKTHKEENVLKKESKNELQVGHGDTSSPIVFEQKITAKDHNEKDEEESDEHRDHHDHHHDKDIYYKFEYSVNDKKTKDVKHQREERKGDKVEGEYSLREDNGNIRTVKYVADWKNGFRAEVANSKKY